MLKDASPDCDCLDQLDGYMLKHKDLPEHLQAAIRERISEFLGPCASGKCPLK